MRKIVVALFALGFAVATQAASLNWTISNVYSSSDSAVKGSGYSALLFLTENTTNVGGLPTTTLETVVGLIGGSDWATAVSGLASAQANLNTSGGVAGSTGVSTDFSSGSLSGFAIIFDAANIADATHYYLVNNGAEKSATFTSPTGMQNLTFGSQATDSANSGNWQAVPEPTTGLLLLLGMAGLALRRKQA